MQCLGGNTPSFASRVAQEPPRKQFYGLIVLAPEVIELCVMYDEILGVKMSLEDTGMLRPHEGE